MKHSTFYAVFEKSTESAWLLSSISLDEKLNQVQIKSAYFPKSKLDFQVYDKSKRILKCATPEWLWSAKIEEASGFKTPSESVFEEVEQLFS